MLRKLLCAACAAGALLLGFASPEERGKEVFGRRCTGCHAIDSNKEGPRLRGVYGRQAAGAPKFAYSEALKKAGVRWDEATLSRWLSDPQAMAPNSDMDFRLSDAGERTAVIAYLKTSVEAKE